MMPSVKRLQFTALIAAPVATVFARMIDPVDYRDWTSAFAEGSYFEGTWQTGAELRFLAPSGDGMFAEIAEYRPNERISIRHLGLIVRGVVDTESESVRAWAPAYENYTFAPTAEGTKLVIDQEVTEEFEKYLVEAWPRALDRLKALCEGAPRA